MHRSYLFAPGHDAKLLDHVFTAGPDAVMLDLEDAVPPEAKSLARRMVRRGARPADRVGAHQRSRLGERRPRHA